VNEDIEAFYMRLLALLRRPVLRGGCWRLLECAPAWPGNASHDGFVAFAWEHAGDERLVVAANLARGRAQCFVRLPFTDLVGRAWRLEDRLGVAVHQRDGHDLQARGLFLDEPAGRACAFTLEEIR
jgi:hypothetical protein